jgi:hypothetical protein
MDTFKRSFEGALRRIVLKSGQYSDVLEVVGFRVEEWPDRPEYGDHVYIDFRTSTGSSDTHVFYGGFYELLNEMVFPSSAEGVNRDETPRFSVGLTAEQMSMIASLVDSCYRDVGPYDGQVSELAESILRVLKPGWGPDPSSVSKRELR